jgi:hypothetical protein
MYRTARFSLLSLAAVSALGVTTLTGSITAAGSAAAADATGTVTIPHHTSDGADLQLIGASSAGLAVRDGNDRLLTGAPGTTLVPRGNYPRTSGTVVGDSVVWTSTTTTSGVKTYALHRMKLATGASTSTRTATPAKAVTTDGWIGLSGTKLKRYRTGGVTSTLLSGVKSVSAAKADAKGVLVAYTSVTKVRHAALITFSSKKVSQLPKPDSTVHTLDLSAGSVAWVTDPKTSDDVVSVHRRARTGGKVTTVKASTWADTPEFALAGARAAWPLSDHQIMVLTGKTTRTVKIPGDYYWGISGLGTDFYLSVSGGNPGAAGVWRVAGAGATRNAVVPLQPAWISDWDMSAGTIHYVDNALTGGGGSPLWQVSVTGTDTPALSTQDELRLVASDSLVSYSGWRGAFVGTAANTGVQLSDANGETTRLDKATAATGFKFSGPFIMAGYRTFDSTGKLRLDLTKTKASWVDLYGANVVYSTTDGKIWYRNLNKKASTTNPKVLVDVCTGSCKPAVGIWGSTVVFQQKDGNLAVRTLTDATARTLTTGVVPASLNKLEVREGSATWSTTAQHNFLIDTDTVGAKAIRTTLIGPVLDGHFMVGKTAAGADGVLQVQRLPFGGAYPPRLIGAVAPAGFSPNSDGLSDVFAPEFDTSKPLTGVTLTIRSASGTVVNTLTSDSTSGSIRSLPWYGTDTTGAKAPAGTYTWELTATAVDGEGALVGVDGKSAVTGSVTLTR